MVISSTIRKGKEAVDVCANTLRKYHALGLPFYYRGKACFVSKSELAMFIRAGAACANRKDWVEKRRTAAEGDQ